MIYFKPNVQLVTNKQLSCKVKVECPGIHTNIIRPFQDIGRVNQRMWRKRYAPRKITWRTRK